MRANKTTEQYIAEAKKVHGNYFDYSITNYVRSSAKVEIICPTHGIFLQRAASHIAGSGCGKCAFIAIAGKLKAASRDVFIQKCKVLHPTLNFDKTVYSKAREKVIVTCPVHGDYQVSACSLLAGAGCIKCAYDKTAKKKIASKKAVFIQRCQALHPTLNFDKTIYTKILNKVIVTCPIHGDYKVQANTLLCGGGCIKCAYDSHKVSKEEWIERFTKKDNNQIDYSLLPDDILSGKPVRFICKKHGIFKRAPGDHIRNTCPCPACGREIMAQKNGECPSGWSDSLWEKSAKKSPRFDSFKVYIIKCTKGSEVFFKIGKTFTSIERRFKYSIPYSYSIKHCRKFDTAKAASTFEHKLKIINKPYKYKPLIPFGGQYECFSKVTLSLYANI